MHSGELKELARALHSYWKHVGCRPRLPSHATSLSLSTEVQRDFIRREERSVPTVGVSMRRTSIADADWMTVDGRERLL